MSIDTTSKGLPRGGRRAVERRVQGEISPRLRKHIVAAAEKIRATHQDELADVRIAIQARRLFGSVICPNEKGTESPGLFGDGAGSLADGVGGLVSDAIRAGTGFLEGSLTVLARAWMTTRKGVAAAPNTNRDATPPGTPPSETSSPEDLMLLEVLRQFMPMLLTAMADGGDGYGLARTVIALFGRPTYDQASKLGKDKILQLVKNDPDLWKQVAPVEDKFGKFLEEFTSYDRRSGLS